MSHQPPDMATVSPILIVKGAAQAIDLYSRVFGAIETSRMEHPETKIVLHSMLKIGNSTLFVTDEQRSAGNYVVQGQQLYIYVEDVDDVIRKAQENGMTITMPPTDMFWGDRMGAAVDKFGYRWSIATFKRQVSQAELKKAIQEASQAQQ